MSAIAMSGLEWIDARSLDEAVRLLSRSDDARPVVAKAGGIDLLDLMKEGLVRPAQIVNLQTIEGLDQIHVDARGGLHVGALARLADVARHALVKQRFAALAAAIEHAATPQVRNAATLGGNLLQRPRCWYFRNERFERGAVAAAARAGENQHHGVFDTDRTPLVHASTPATALLAYGATIFVSGPHGERSIPIEDFFLPPEPTRACDVAMRPGEVLTHVELPASHGAASAYHKQTERESYDWPICDVAAVLRLREDRTVSAASVALGWVAPTPRKASEAEAMLMGRVVDERVANEAARAITSKAQPLPKNGYKVEVLEVVLARTLLAASKSLE